MEIAEIAEFLDIRKLPVYVAQINTQIEACFLKTQAATKLPALRLVKSGGKRLRSTLVIATCLSLGGEVTLQVIGAAAAVELAHLGSLVHDDILDHAAQRGSLPSIYAKEGIDRAILIGDYMLAAAAHEAAQVSGDIGTVVSEAIMEMCEGQMRETVDTYNIGRTIHNYQATIRKKTAALIAAACQVGGLCAEASPLQQKYLRNYGEAFGMSFQLLDDVLDFLATAEAMGKPVNNDVKEGVYTLPVLLSLAGKSADKVRALLDKGSFKPTNYQRLLDILKRDRSFELTLDEVRRHNQAAERALQKINAKSSTKTGLIGLPGLYTQQALGKQTLL